MPLKNVVTISYGERPPHTLKPNENVPHLQKGGASAIDEISLDGHLPRARDELRQDGTSLQVGME